jgi:hypothetical protein
MTYTELTEMLADARPDEWLHDDDQGVWTFKRDLQVTVRERRGDADLGTLAEPWATRLGHDPVHVRIFDLWFGASLVKGFYFASVDGTRALLPYPKTQEDLTITHEQWGIAVAVNSHTGHLDEYLAQAGIRVIR